MFIKLHNYSFGFPIWVNMSHVRNVEEAVSDGAWLSFTDTDGVKVRESPQEIFSVISYFSCKREPKVAVYEDNLPDDYEVN